MNSLEEQVGLTNRLYKNPRYLEKTKNTRELWYVLKADLVQNLKRKLEDFFRYGI